MPNARTSTRRYLQKRRRLWYATLDIPKDVRLAFNGKARFVQSLGTDSLSAAERRAGVLVSKWKREIAAARQSSDTLEEEARWYRLHLPTLSDADREATEYALQDKAEAIERQDTGAGVSFYKRATGQIVGTTDHLNEWIGTLSGNEQKTKDMKRSDVARMAKRFPAVADIGKRDVQRWANDLVETDQLAPKTVSRIISHSRGYWHYLQSIEVAPDDVEPFHSVGVKVSGKSKASRANERRAFKPPEVVTLLRAAEARGDDHLSRLIWLGMWTGCRIEELCALRCDQVNLSQSADASTLASVENACLKQGYFEVEDAKTPAGWRQVPIHSQLMDFMKKATKKSEDGYVLSGLTLNKYGDRSNAVGKRFGRLKVALGFGPQHVFHSIRKTVVTLLRHAGVDEAIAADIVGHDIPTMTYGLYGKGDTLARKAKAIEKIAYPL